MVCVGGRGVGTVGIIDSQIQTLRDWCQRLHTSRLGSVSAYIVGSDGWCCAVGASSSHRYKGAATLTGLVGGVADGAAVGAV